VLRGLSNRIAHKACIWDTSTNTVRESTFDSTVSINIRIPVLLVAAAGKEVSSNGVMGSLPPSSDMAS